ncbi:MAG: asparagine synthase-related protein [Gaiellaceae bacterium]
MTGSEAGESRASRFRFTALEIAAGAPLGFDTERGLPVVPASLTPLAAFEDAIRSALARPPCVVTFSGGRDSSAVLAVAARLARDEQLQPPIALTLRLLDAPGSSELEWQERVVGHIGLEDWVRIEVGEELDYVGPLGQRMLLRHGVAHHAAPLFWLQAEPARGGSLLTGFGGDTTVGGWLSPRSSELLVGRARPAPGDLLVSAYALAPAVIRRGVFRARTRRRAWMRNKAARAFAAARASELGSRPVRWDRYLEWQARLRRYSAVESALSALAADVDAINVHPFFDRRFLAALARAGRRRGLGDRSAVMRHLFSADLPEDVLTRSTKANFALAFFRSHTRAFARRWDGRGLDADLVDAEALRSVWLSPLVNSASALALQAAWLDSALRGVEQLPADLV